MYKLFPVAFLLIFSAHLALSQALLPSGAFLKDNLKIGEEVDYSLSIKYPKNIDIIFPDTSYSFAPFDFLSKVSYPTRSDSLFSFDSAVYRLTTFEIDSVQVLNLPIFLVTGGDSLEIFPGPDSVSLFFVVESIPDSISMIENTAYSNVKLGFNYPYLIVGISILVVGAIIIFLVFGKTIKKKITLYRLNKKHMRFLEKFNAAIARLKEENDYSYFEHLLMDWKNYMEKLHSAPYTKLTSREIQKVYPDKHLNQSLMTIDKAIYGGFKIPDLSDRFDYLRRISEDSFHNKIQEIKNG